MAVQVPQVYCCTVKVFVHTHSFLDRSRSAALPKREAVAVVMDVPAIPQRRDAALKGAVGEVGLTSAPEVAGQGSEEPV